MAWTGRKRSAGERHPGGKLKRSKPAAPPPQPHRKGYGSDPLAETVHGRYRLDGAINQQQWLAGAFYGRSRLRYRAAIGSPDSLRSRSEGRPDGEERDDAKVIAEHEAARHALGRLTVDIEWVVCADAMLADLTSYRAGLDILRRFYRV
jgi:hypothetical protein